MSSSTVYDDYKNRYESVAFERDESGILEIALHTRGDSLVWGAIPHRELAQAFADVGNDRENRVVILTGAGKDFCATRDTSLNDVRSSAQAWDVIYWEGKRLIQNLLDIEVPIIAAVNGPARYHPELAVVSDIVLASETAIFQDKPHLPVGVVPGDGAQFIWPLILGPNRGRYFLLTGQEINASDALDLGIVSEVLAPENLLPRARELARELAKNPTLTLRYTRVLLTRTLRQLASTESSHGLGLEGLAILSLKG